MHYVIVGNGVCGIEAAITLRNRDADARITLISGEHDHFFARTALMYLFCGQLSLPDIEPYGRDLYARMRWERVRGVVQALMPSAHQLQLGDGQVVTYDRLLLAVGSKARPLPWPGAYDPPAVHHFVTLADHDRLNVAARPGQRAAVIGGGLIGIEVAEVLRQRGLQVSFLIREPFYFPVALDAREAEVVAAHMRHHGVDVRLGAEVQGIAAGGRGRLVKLAGDTLDVEHVIGAIGVVPNTDFLRSSGLARSEVGAIEVDAYLQTNQPDVFAAGDCANVTWVDGSRRPEQLWYTARDQGRAAAANLLGDGVPYRRGAWYNSAKFFDVEYTTAGWVPPAPTPAAYQTWYQQVPGQPVTQRILLKDGRVVGFNALGSRWDHTVFLRWIQERRPLDYVLAHMNKARFDEEFTPPFLVLPTATLT